MEVKKCDPLLGKKCKCCLNDDRPLKDLWAEYYVEGDREIYGEMLTECFALSWQQPLDYDDLICTSCIDRLRSAYDFRKEVLTSEQIMQQLANCLGNPKQAVKDEDKADSDEDWEPMGSAESLQDSDQEELDEEEQEKSDVEYLEIDFLEDETVNIPETSKGAKRKKQDKGDYKKYTENQLEQCLDMVRTRNMTKSTAAAIYNVPSKTIAANLKPKLKNSNDQENKEKQLKFLSEIKTILTYTNATPVRTKAARYYCVYCTTEGPRFENADDLRTHTRTEHAEERVKHVDIFMRPFYFNEILKLDIVNLTCTVCCTPIDSWNDMFTHLKELHDVELDQAYTRVIPYLLNEKLLCALCNEKFPAFHVIDGHMNAHYSNYICDDCGDTFLAESRLKKHVENHSVGKHPCSECGKVFSLDKYRKKHFDNVHSGEPKTKCVYCNQKFKGDYARHQHVLEQHKEKIKKTTCEECGKEFQWRPYYLKHMRLMHKKKEKKHKCNLCDKSFKMNYELKNHMDWHKGSSDHVCAICQRKFTSKAYLQKHYGLHFEDGGAIVIETTGLIESLQS